jgi:hypothetical protein
MFYHFLNKNLIISIKTAKIAIEKIAMSLKLLNKITEESFKSI